MKLFLIVVSLYSVIQTCYSNACVSLPPGLDRLSHGIDITSFDLLPDDLTQANGFARTIFDFTCNKGKKWTNPFIAGLVYDLPDQVEAITHLPGGILDQQIEISSTFTETKVAKSNKVGLGFLGGMFSFSHSSAKMRDDIIGGDKVHTSVSAHVSAIEVDLVPYWTETPGLYIKQFYDQFLPNTYQENPAKYQEFLSTFGTHYFTTARFGGLMKVDINTDSNYCKHTDQHSRSIQAGISFLTYLSLSGGHSKENLNADNNFKQYSTIKEAYYGGNANLINTGLNGFQGWWDSAQRNPWIFGGQLTSILTFIPNGPKKNALNIAVDVKMNYAYLDELHQSLNILNQFPYVDHAATNNMINQIVALRGQVIPARATVVNLGNAIENFINVQKAKKPLIPLCNIKTDYVKGKVVKKTCVNPAKVANCQCVIP